MVASKDPLVGAWRARKALLSCHLFPAHRESFLLGCLPIIWTHQLAEVLCRMSVAAALSSWFRGGLLLHGALWAGVTSVQDLKKQLSLA